MNFFKVATNVPIARTCTSLLIPRVTLRSFSSTPAVFTVTQKNKKNKNFDKFYKILKYTKPIDETQYEIGQQHPKGLRIPSAIPEFPKYKYEARFFKRQNRGLYGGLQRKRSKTCSEYFNKNLRAHRPNIRRAKLWSEILNEKINVKVSTRVLRTLTKEGGVDQYLLKSTPARIKTMGLTGWKLRYKLLNELEQKERGQVEVPSTTGELKPVTYIHKPDGRKFIATKQELLAALYDLVQRDSYYPIKPAEFDRQYSWLPMSEIVNRLDAYEYDFSGKVVV
ncbi:Ribosomal L28 family protein [Candida parapsilosis]|uniref:Ribosomal protein L28 n=2 Tax=Candida parapsilosis TaxID=5480 RepID=G8BDZ7_CANPC|nr:uncharacterized protein CPAR2_211380 [Candida parapsilosis]KAF6054357.1 Ribosomal L28 family protein [Candida parapsilosis]KAF6056619.1 Ribosomal L28 family protein [Candida parapsilosis]KAF6059554.1 Ribosomal L28 family protein [Candida parapsilosis]KAF6068307.1 Ribosomal L28 family protein [Candida parapsilosis]CCE43494.1 hypothetical protein CPAR2_211380 [Candida parapsilosis]